MVLRCTGYLVAVLACFLALPSRAMTPAPDVIVGRADADASGGWPVALWVIGAQRSHFIVRSSREQLGRLSWRRADARALMALERFGAPALTQTRDAPVCSVPVWPEGKTVEPLRRMGSSSEDSDLAHPVCSSGHCGAVAWRVDLPGAPDQPLPLRKLLPELGATRPQWLVLYVVSPLPMLPLKGLAQLHLAEALRGQRSLAQWSQLRLPAEAAAQFPAIHATLLDQAARDQGLVGVSALMRADRLPRDVISRRDSNWEEREAQYRRALGIAGQFLGDETAVRLLLRLVPDDRPAELALDAAPWRAMAEYGGTLSALEPLPLACGDKQDAAQRALFDELAARQQQAWRWVEQMTGRPAAEWQAR